MSRFSPQMCEKNREKPWKRFCMFYCESFSPQMSCLSPQVCLIYHDLARFVCEPVSWWWSGGVSWCFAAIALTKCALFVVILSVNCQLTSKANCQLPINWHQRLTANCQLPINWNQRLTANCHVATVNCQLPNCQYWTSKANCQLPTGNCQLTDIKD